MRANAVENFLSSMDPEIPGFIHLANLHRDAKVYRWDRETVRAIKDGIKKRYTYPR